MPVPEILVKLVALQTNIATYVPPSPMVKQQSHPAAAVVQNKPKHVISAFRFLRK